MAKVNLLWKLEQENPRELCNRFHAFPCGHPSAKPIDHGFKSSRRLLYVAIKSFSAHFLNQNVEIV